MVSRFRRTGCHPVFLVIFPYRSNETTGIYKKILHYNHIIHYFFTHLIHVSLHHKSRSCLKFLIPDPIPERNINIQYLLTKPELQQKMNESWFHSSVTNRKLFFIFCCFHFTAIAPGNFLYLCMRWQPPDYPGKFSIIHFIKAALRKKFHNEPAVIHYV